MNGPSLTLPLILIASLWGAVSATLQFFSMLNQRRDQAFALLQKCGACPDELLGPLQIYFTNMLPLSLGACLFLFLICYVIVKIPDHIAPDKKLRGRIVYSCYYIATLPFFGFISFLIGAVFDFTVIKQLL
ncbi:MAG: hypothetical protein ACPG4U_06705 [Pseudomonadales bacterium]